MKGDWLPLLEWMKSLEKLALIKLESFQPGKFFAGDERTSSRLLDALIGLFLFPPLKENVKPTLRPLRCIWIHNLYVRSFQTALDYADPEHLQSYRTGAHYGHENELKSFHNLVQLDGKDDVSLGDSLLPDLSKLKYFTVSSYDDEEVIIIPLSFEYEDFIQIL